MQKVKMVRFKNPTNCGMVRYRAGELYPIGPGVQKWLDKSMNSGCYTIVDAPAESAAEPGELRKPKVSSRTASSRKERAKAAATEAGAS